MLHSRSVILSLLIHYERGAPIEGHTWWVDKVGSAFIIKLLTTSHKLDLNVIFDNDYSH